MLLSRPVAMRQTVQRIFSASCIRSPGPISVSHHHPSLRRPYSGKAPRRQNSLPASYYRGGTSRAIFFHSADLPADRAAWPAIFRGCIGSPDADYGRQLDGLGGGVSSLSKVCVVGPSRVPGADVDYTFVSLGIRNSNVDYSSNCGNMSAAVGPFAVDAGIVSVPESAEEAVVRINNTNTEKLIEATFPMAAGEASAYGDFAIDGVADTAAKVQLKFLHPAGSRTGKLFPTGAVQQNIADVNATCIDAGNPCCFVPAAELGIPGTLTPAQIEKDEDLCKKLELIRRTAAIKMGLATDLDKVPGSVPKIAIVSRPLGQQENTVVIRAMSVGQPHKAIPVTVALAAAAAANVQGTTVAEALSEGSSVGSDITILHASGTLDVAAEFDSEGDLQAATVYRTARRLMEGRVFWK